MLAALFFQSRLPVDDHLQERAGPFSDRREEFLAVWAHIISSDDPRSRNIHGQSEECSRTSKVRPGPGLYRHRHDLAVRGKEEKLLAISPPAWEVPSVMRDASSLSHQLRRTVPLKALHVDFVAPSVVRGKRQVLPA